ncbi:hypothetical protein GCM10009801_17840 [Streptomyces albiaxialis]|uniref:Uncharacterized protein n=1 Tax=Streptomyces albiaxialis TaxID=329523 RepID=A0ABP5HBT1_9ACTN
MCLLVILLASHVRAGAGAVQALEGDAEGEGVGVADPAGDAPTRAASSATVHGRVGGTVSGPSDQARSRRARLAASLVDAEDIAAVAVAALTGDGHAGRMYELSGPRARRPPSSWTSSSRCRTDGGRAADTRTGGTCADHVGR